MPKCAASAVFIIMILCAGFAGLIGGLMGMSGDSLNTLGEWIGAIGMLLLPFPYYMIFMGEVGGGQSIGYKLLGLQLVDETSHRPPAAGPLMLWTLCLLFLGFIGFLWFFWDKQSRMLHNVVSTTIVKRMS